MQTLKESIKELAGVLNEDCKLKYYNGKIKTPDYFSNKHVEERTQSFINHINNSPEYKAVKPYMIWLQVFTEHRAVAILNKHCPIGLNGVYEENNQRKIEITK